MYLIISPLFFTSTKKEENPELNLYEIENKKNISLKEYLVYLGDEFCDLEINTSKYKCFEEFLEDFNSHSIQSRIYKKSNREELRKNFQQNNLTIPHLSKKDARYISLYLTDKLSHRNSYFLYNK